MLTAVAAAGTALLIHGCGDSGTPSTKQPTPLIISVPGFPELSSPQDNPLTVEGVELGRKLFYDPILSADSSLACAGCHQQSLAFTDGKAVAEGHDGQLGTRGSMSLTNAGWNRSHFWDGRAEDLESQAEQPVPNPIEMNLPWPDALTRLESHPQYPEWFEEAFGERAITRDRVVQAISQFERTLVSNHSRFDRWARGELMLTPQEVRGYVLFNTERGDCFHCHNEPMFTDNLFHNNGLDADFEDLGRESVTGDVLQRGMFKTPTLRNVELTAPYMHDGRFSTLREAVQHYNSGGVFSLTVDPLIRVGSGLGLTEAEVDDLVAFIKALTDTSFITDPRFSDPFIEN